MLKRLTKVNSLIPMNLNVLQRLNRDTGANLDSSMIIPLPVIESDLNYRPIHESTKLFRIVWLGRIVDFKIPAILSMIDFVSNNAGYQYDIIGYGYEDVVNDYISFKNIPAGRVNLIGKVPHDQLDSQLSSYHVGYGMGTSVIEMVGRGLPTIVALAKPNFKQFKQPICAGFVHEQKYGNVGDDLYVNSENDCPLIADTLTRAQKTPKEIYDLDFLSINKVFNLEDNISKYFEVMNSCDAVNVLDLKLPEVGFMKRVVNKWLVRK